MKTTKEMPYGSVAERQPAPDRASAQEHAQKQWPLSSAQLMGGRKEVAIAHNGSLYKLRITSNGKLILTK